MLYILLKRAAEAEVIGKTIAADLVSDVEEAVAAAAQATRHWANLSAIGCVPDPPPSLLITLIERVIFRSKPGISSCLLQLSCLLREQPKAITPSQAALLCASLTSWHHATILPVPDEGLGDFHEAERPDLRVRIGYLAGVLQIWHTKFASGVPAPVALSLWRKLCAEDALPEMRRAFNAGSQKDGVG